MAKRHYDSMMKKSGESSMEGYAGMDTRERNQYRKGEYVSEDRNGYADLPQQVEYKMYEKAPYGMDMYLDDGIGGIDSQMSEDRARVKSGLKPQKF